MYMIHVIRYGISYKVGQPARAISEPSEVHMRAATHLLQRLARTVPFGITCTYQKGYTPTPTGGTTQTAGSQLHHT